MNTQINTNVKIISAEKNIPTLKYFFVKYTRQQSVLGKGPVAVHKVTPAHENKEKEDSEGGGDGP